MFKNLIQLKSLRTIALGLTVGLLAMESQAQQNQAPTVTINYPAQNANFSTQALIEISSIPQDADGSITKVEYRNSAGTLVSTQTGPPYKYNLGVSPLPAGTYTYTAVAYDNLGATSAPASVVFSVGAVPTVSFYYPSNNTVFHAYTPFVEIAATPKTADGTLGTPSTISKVEYRNAAGILVATTTGPPYRSGLGKLAAGNYTYSAVAFDLNGVASAPAYVSFSVAANLAPAVTFTAPAKNSTFAENTTVKMVADAVDPEGGVSRVEFYNQAGTLVFTDNLAPFEYTTAPLAVGNYVYTVVAFDYLNVASNTAYNNFSVVVNRAPAVTFTAPAKNSVFPANTAVTLVADAVDPEGYLNRVEFYNQSGALVFTDYSAPYQYTTAALAPGNYIYTTVAFDNLGQSSNIASNNFTISQPVTCTAAQWNANTAYNSGQIVQYAGIRYQANWWTQNQRPDLNSGVSGSGQPWTNLGTCTSRAEAAEAISSLSIYPNPTADVLNVSVGEGQVELLEVSNFSGDVLLSAKNSSIINVASLSAGIYTVKIQTAGVSTTQKFVKQ